MAAKMDPEIHPLVTIEAMLKGSLKRLGDFFSDPQNFGSMTHDVLIGTSTRYQEALDKCEIQILNAKWILEYQLAEVRAQRAAKSAEVVNAAKRKHEESEAAKAAEETPSKKQKNQTADGEVDHLSALDETLKSMEAENNALPDPPILETSTTTEQSSSSAPAPAPIPAIDGPAPSIEDQSGQPTQEDQPPQTATSQNIDFDSMFGDFAGDDTGDGDNQEINFDDLDNMDTNNFDLMIAQSENPSQPPEEQSADPGNDASGGEADASLNSLLPGLESYANATDQSTNNQQQQGNQSPPPPPNLNAPDTTTATADDSTFDLPEITDTTTFDDLFGMMAEDNNNNSNQATTNFGDGGQGGGNTTADDDLLNDDSILELGTFDDNWLMDS